MDACDAWEDPTSDEDEMAKQFPGLSRGAACNWAIYGLTTQDWYTLEWTFSVLAKYIEDLRNIIDTQTDLAEKRYEIIKAAHQAIEEAHKASETVE